MMKKTEVSWDRYGELLAGLVAKLKKEDLTGIEHVYGIPRGGLPIATYIAHQLNLELIFQISSFRRTLIVDDIADTGQSLKKYTRYKTATLFYKKRSVVKPTVFVEEVEDWIVFPYEDKTKVEKEYQEFCKKRLLDF